MRVAGLASSPWIRSAVRSRARMATTNNLFDENLSIDNTTSSFIEVNTITGHAGPE
jgi:hypothetical protein